MGNDLSDEPRPSNGAEPAQEGTTAAAETGVGYDRLFGAFQWLVFRMYEGEGLHEAVRKPEGVEMHKSVAGTGGPVPEEEPKKAGPGPRAGIEDGDETGG